MSERFYVVGCNGIINVTKVQKKKTEGKGSLYMTKQRKSSLKAFESPQEIITFPELHPT